MTTQEMKERFAQLYTTMANSKDVANMKYFGTAFARMFDNVATRDPKLAMATLESLEAMEYNNFVTRDEAVEVAAHFINDDMKVMSASEPSKGAHWSMDALKGFLSQKGLPLDDKPYYNWPALWLTVNMIYSDYADAFVSLLDKKDNETMAIASYTIAIKKLKDLDRPRFVREYFRLDR